MWKIIERVDGRCPPIVHVWTFGKAVEARKTFSCLEGNLSVGHWLELWEGNRLLVTARSQTAKHQGMPINVKTNINKAREAMGKLGEATKQTSDKMRRLANAYGGHKDFPPQYDSDDLSRAWAKHERAKKCRIVCQPNYADPEES